MEAFASQAAIAISNRMLINQLEALFESFIQLINVAIDDKSPYTSRHCARVPALTMMLADAAHETEGGVLKDFRMTERDRHELKLAGLLHDCGKITTPVHVVDKATKLQTIFDRIHLIDIRFEVLKRDLQVDALKETVGAMEQGARDKPIESERRLSVRLRQLDADREFLRRCKLGVEAMRPEDQTRISQIASYQLIGPYEEPTRFLSEDEEENLTTRSGTLTDREREVINYHIVATIRMLDSLPWPKHLTNVADTRPAITSALTAKDIRAACAATRCRFKRESWLSRTYSRRSPRPTAPTRLARL